MQKKSIIAILSSVVLMVVASLALVFTVGPKTSAANETIYTVPTGYLDIQNDVLKGFTTNGKNWINGKKYCVVIPYGVTSIGWSAFFECRGLTSITIPEGVTSIGGDAFRRCSGLTSITIPDGVTSIGSSTFAGCSSLTSITIPDGVTSIGSRTFEECSSLTSITIPERVTSIGNQAFSSCSGLTSITIPNSVTSIGTYAFYNCSGLTSITIPEDVTSIGKSTFCGCRGLTSITIPEGVTSIGENAFNSCSGLTSITIPEDVTSIGYAAFSGCSGLNEIIVRNPDLMTDTNLQSYASKLHYGAEQNTVTFNTMGGTTISEQTIDFGELVSEPISEKIGYHVSGWYLDEEYTKPFTFDTPIKYDITLYAKWEENPTVTFIVDDTEYNSETIEYNTTVSVPTEPTKTGYTFMGWYRNNAAYDFNTLVTENITLTAKWNINRYMVDFNRQGATVNSVFVNYGDLVAEPTISRTGYTLLGWFVDDEIDQKFNFNTPITDNIGLWAKWSINQYDVIFDSNGGNAVAPQRNVEYNTLLTVPETPTREGYNFLGWYNGDEAYDFTTPVSQDMTLTAKWEAVQAQPEPETPDEETSTEVNNQNNNGLLWGILGTSGGILLVGGIVFGIVISKRRRK